MPETSIERANLTPMEMIQVAFNKAIELVALWKKLSSALLAYSLGGLHQAS